MQEHQIDVLLWVAVCILTANDGVVYFGSVNLMLSVKSSVYKRGNIKCIYRESVLTIELTYVYPNGWVSCIFHGMRDTKEGEKKKTKTTEKKYGRIDERKNGNKYRASAQDL